MNSQTPRSRSPMNQLSSSTNYQTDYVRLITQDIDHVGKIITEYLRSQGSIHNRTQEIEDLKQSLYSSTFNMIFEQLQGNPSKKLFDSDVQHHNPMLESSLIQNDDQLIVNQLQLYLSEFKKEVLLQVIERPQASLFDFVVSQTFNDLWNILTTCQNSLSHDHEITQLKAGQNLTQSQSLILCNNKGKFTRRSRSVEKLNRVQNQEIRSQQNTTLCDIEFVLTQQLVSQLNGTSQAKKFVNAVKQAKQIRDDMIDKTFDSSSPTQRSPKRNQTQLPQLFSFDSSFVKDLPLSRNPLISNFDNYNHFTSPINNPLFQGTLSNISGIIREEDEFGFSSFMDQTKDQPTSRFENNQILNENDSEGREQKYVTFKKKNHNQNENERLRKDREKDIASKELMLLIQEKQVIQMKNTLLQDRKELQSQREHLTEETSSFYQFRDQELRSIEQTSSRLEQMKQQLTQREKSLKKELSLNQVQKENISQNTNQRSLGNLKGNLKDIIERMKINQ